MKKRFTRILAALALLVGLTIPMLGMAQTTSELTLSSSKKFGTTSGSTLQTETDPQVTWTVTTNSGVSGTIQNSYQNAYHGQQFGTSGATWGGTFSASYSDNVTSVKVDANTGGAATLSVTVGGNAFTYGGNQTEVNVVKNSSSTGPNYYEFLGNGSGAVVISLVGSSKACYFGGVIVTYSSGGSQNPTYVLSSAVTPANAGTVTLSETSLEEGDEAIAEATANAHYTFTSWSLTGEGATLSSTTTNPTTVTMGTANATITATFTEDQKYNITYNANYEGSTDDPVVVSDYAGETMTIAPYSTFSRTGYAITSWNTQANGSGTAYNAGDEYTMTSAGLNLYAQWEEINETVDQLTHDLIGVTESSYTAWEGKTSNSDAVYAGNSAGGDSNSGGCIQIRSKDSNSGIVTTATGGFVRKIEVTWNSATADGRTLDVYGSNSAYESAANLYVNNTQGTKLGSIVNGTSTVLVIDGDYEYVGLRSASGAMYLDEIDITWVPNEDPAVATTVTIDDTNLTNTNLFFGNEAGSLSATVKDDEDNPIEAVVTWTSNKPSVATITSAGVVTLVGKGTATITAEYAGVAGEYKPSFTTYQLVVINKDPNAGTENHPYSVAEARELINELGSASSEIVYVTGKIYNVSSFNSTYSSLTYWISDDGQGSTSSFDGLQVYGGLSFNGDGFESQNDLAVGDVVVVKGNLKKYNKTYEFDKNNELVSLIHDGSYSKAIKGYGESAGGYYLIASPVSTAPADAGMITDDLGDGATPENATYDLYYYNHNATDGLEWRNYRKETFGLTPGTGYLYANKENVTLTFAGDPYEGEGVFPIVAGWTLVGNPFGVAAEISSDYYAMNQAGSELTPVTASTNVSAMQGVFVYSAQAGTVMFAEAGTESNNNEDNIVVNIGHQGTAIDRAIVRFGQGDQLPKFQLNPNNTKVYIPQGNKDYAIVRSAAEAEMPVSFRASENGTYTLAVEAENVEMNYLHLIDNLTGMDVDLLQTPSYTFEAKTSDYASRFRLVFKANGTNENNAETFADRQQRRRCHPPGGRRHRPHRRQPNDQRQRRT